MRCLYFKASVKIAMTHSVHSAQPQGDSHKPKYHFTAPEGICHPSVASGWPRTTRFSTPFSTIEGGMPNNSGTAQGKSGVLTWNHMTGHFIKGRMVGLTSNGWSLGSPAGVRLAVNGRPRSAQSSIHACGSGISTRCPDWIDCTAQIPGKVICAARIGPIGAVVPSRMACSGLA